MSVRDTFFVYEILRRGFLFGLRIKPILECLDAKPGEKILDAGCGFGHLAKYFKHCNYTGVDLDPERIEWAKKNVGETPTRRFITADVCQTDLQPKSFDKALGYGLLHHLSDDTADRCLAELSRIVKGKTVFSDPVYSRAHWFSNMLCRMDRGEHVRDKKGYLELCRKKFSVQSQRYFYSRNGFAKYFLTASLPKTFSAVAGA